MKNIEIRNKLFKLCKLCEQKSCGSFVNQSNLFIWGSFSVDFSRNMSLQAMTSLYNYLLELLAGTIYQKRHAALIVSMKQVVAEETELEAMSIRENAPIIDDNLINKEIKTLAVSSVAMFKNSPLFSGKSDEEIKNIWVKAFFNTLS